MLDRLFPPEDDDCGHCHQDHSIPSSGRGIAEANSSPQYHHHYQYDGGDMTAPFGGFKQSGNGRDKSLHAFDKYTELKATWIKL